MDVGAPVEGPSVMGDRVGRAKVRTGCHGVFSRALVLGCLARVCLVTRGRVDPLEKAQRCRWSSRLISGSMCRLRHVDALKGRSFWTFAP